MNVACSLINPGTTTTCESLFMGVPCITLAGGCHAHNVSASLLAAVGLSREWVAHTEDEYVDLAVHHASNVKVRACQFCKVSDIISEFVV